QWQFNGEDIPGATNETLILRNVDETNEGAYRVRVANSVGEVFSAESILRIVMPPIDILAQPADGAASLGQSISLVVWLTNLPEPSFQWFLGGVPISGATNYEFRILRATTNDGGIYSVLVSNK